MELDPPDVLLMKARDDQRLLTIMVNAPEASDEQFGFFCQQAIEKRLKSVLSRGRHSYPRTHSLGALIDLLDQQEIEAPEALRETVILTPFAAQLRYDYVFQSAAPTQPLDRGWAVHLVSLAVEWATGLAAEK